MVRLKETLEQVKQWLPPIHSRFDQLIPRFYVTNVLGIRVDGRSTLDGKTLLIQFGDQTFQWKPRPRMEFIPLGKMPIQDLTRRRWILPILDWVRGKDVKPTFGETNHRYRFPLWGEILLSPEEEPKPRWYPPPDRNPDFESDSNQDFDPDAELFQTETDIAKTDIEVIEDQTPLPEGFNSIEALSTLWPTDPDVSGVFGTEPVSYETHIDWEMLQEPAPEAVPGEKFEFNKPPVDPADKAELEAAPTKPKRSKSKKSRAK